MHIIFLGTIDNLIPGKRYIFRIKARTRIGGGNWVVWDQEMPVWAPPTPDRRSIATIVARTMTTVTLRFRRNYFSDEHGMVKAYAIIVTEDYSKTTQNKPRCAPKIINLTQNLLRRRFQNDIHNAFLSCSRLPTWQQVQQFRTWPPYQASDPYYPFNNSSVEDFTVGIENCENKVDKVYCNGPLKPGGLYRFKIRAYTTQEQFSGMRTPQ